MAKEKSIVANVFCILGKGIKLYFLNFEKFIKYMAFPIFGQIIGITLVFAAAYVFTLKAPALTSANPVFDNILLVFLLLLLISLPGFFIFTKAFWDYLIAMVSLNSMASTLAEGGTLDDVSVHDDMARKRSGSYVILLLLLAIITLIGLLPPFWLFMVYLTLTFQVFALEDDISAPKAIATSINLIKGNYARTILLIFLLYVITYWLVPSLICWGFEAGNLLGFFTYPVERFIDLLPFFDPNSGVTLPVAVESREISRLIVLSTVSFAVTGFALPLRSVCCTMLYKELYSNNYAGKIAAEKLVKRARTPKIKED